MLHFSIEVIIDVSLASGGEIMKQNEKLTHFNWMKNELTKEVNSVFLHYKFYYKGSLDCELSLSEFETP